MAQRFAIVYAAGDLAKHYKVLPESVSCGPSAITAYALHVHNRPTHVTLIDLLSELAERAETVVIDDATHFDDERAKAIEDARIIVKRARHGHDELLIRPGHRRELIPQLSIFAANGEVEGVWENSDKGHHTVQRILIPGGRRERVFCFRLPTHAI